jgi:5,10-methylenetetrahydromethanopterin reductase
MERLNEAAAGGSRADQLAVGFLGTPTLPRMVQLARQAEAAGFASVWVAETRLRRDAVSAAAAIAAGTTRLRVATGLVNVYTRNPVLLAVTAASLAELASGRFVLGLGAGSEGVLWAQGIDYERPFTRLREYVEVLRALLAGEAVDYTAKSSRSAAHVWR